MARYVILINFTDRGISTYQDTLKRASAAQEAASTMGAALTDIVWCMGEYDIVGSLEAPDDETATAFALKLSSLGNIRTTTMRAFTRDEVEGILAKSA
jgi:uncharacterized protein with GYD domain